MGKVSIRERSGLSGLSLGMGNQLKRNLFNTENEFRYPFLGRLTGVAFHPDFIRIENATNIYKLLFLLNKL
ncbi:MAG: hypothetical protein ACK59Y_04390 [Betaproteobacteria bacterium]|jgi:hypothetical protein